MSHVSFKVREREVGKAVETVARNSCHKFVYLEKENELKGINYIINHIKKD